MKLRLYCPGVGILDHQDWKKLGMCSWIDRYTHSLILMAYFIMSSYQKVKQSSIRSTKSYTSFAGINQRKSRFGEKQFFSTSPHTSLHCWFMNFKQITTLYWCLNLHIYIILPGVTFFSFQKHKEFKRCFFFFQAKMRKKCIAEFY